MNETLFIFVYIIQVSAEDFRKAREVVDQSTKLLLDNKKKQDQGTLMHTYINVYKRI